ncbi:hypothetical protein ACFL59_11775 [Planctomycetota bacterium]
MWARTQVQYERIIERQIAKLRSRSEMLTRLIKHDRVVTQMFKLSQEELRELIQVQTTRRPNVVTLEKSVGLTGAAIVPGDTFEYTLKLHNVSRETIENVVIYDQLPVGLQFENRYSVSFRRSDGLLSQVSGEGESLISFLTPNEWETGKIAWHLPRSLSVGESLHLAFCVTWYRERGVPASDGAPLLAQAATGAGTRARLNTCDLVYVTQRGEKYHQVWVRRADSGARLDGYLASGDFRPLSDLDDTDQEQLLVGTVYSRTQQSTGH